MYTEYPIFPEHKVHIPTTPNYNKRLKSIFEIFLNEGGTLKDIESKIEVSETVVKQSYVEMFDGPQLRCGDVITILFDADSPDRSAHIRDMYQRALPVMFGVIVLLPPLGLLALSVFFEMTYRDLEKVDPVRTRLPRMAVFSGVGGQL